MASKQFSAQVNGPTRTVHHIARDMRIICLTMKTPGSLLSDSKYIFGLLNIYACVMFITRSTSVSLLAVSL